MLLSTQDAGRASVLRRPPESGVVAGAGAAAASRGRGEAARSAQPVLRSGLKAIDPALNSRVAGAQKSVDYLDRLAAELGGIRSSIRDRMQSPGSAPGASSPHSLESRIQRFSELWSRRVPESAGSLDSTLEYHADGVARQTFRVRGLDFATMRSGNPEIISLSVGGQGFRGAASAAIEPGLSDQAIARRFDRALAGSGIRALIGDDGELRFSVAESDWPKVRDSLAIRGEGQHFPTGRFSQVRALPDAAAIRPQEWQTHDEDALRGTRQSVFTAESLVRRARTAVSDRLSETSRAFDASGAREHEVVTSSAKEIGQMLAAAAEGTDYGALAAVLPAVSRVDRERVATLLRQAPGAE